MKHLILAAFGTLIITCFADAQPLMSVGAEPKLGTLDGVEFESCAVTPFLNNFRIYLCYRKRVDGDLVVGERVLGSDEPVKEHYPERVISRIVFAVENSFDQSQTLFFEYPKETFRDLKFPHLGPVFHGYRTHLAIVLQAQTLTVFMSGGDGAGSYKVNWVIDVKEHKVRRIDSVGEEGDDVSRTGSWLELKEIPTPKVAFQSKK